MDSHALRLESDPNHCKAEASGGMKKLIHFIKNLMKYTKTLNQL